MKTVLVKESKARKGKSRADPRSKGNLKQAKAKKNIKTVLDKVGTARKGKSNADPRVKVT